MRFLKKEQGGYQTMCEAAEKLVKSGIEEGFEQGRVQGIEQGITKGIQQGEINNSRKLAIKMYQKGSKPEEIAEFLETSVDQVKEWLEL